MWLLGFFLWTNMGTYDLEWLGDLKFMVECRSSNLETGMYSLNCKALQMEESDANDQYPIPQIYSRGWWWSQ